MIRWHQHAETWYPVGPVSPDPARLEPLGFPPPWRTRPWIYANVTRRGTASSRGSARGPRTIPPARLPAATSTRPGRLADVRLMRHLRACADVFSIGAQTLRDQPDLIGAADDLGGELGEALRRFRVQQGRRRFPLQVVYSGSGRLSLDAPIFNTPELTAIVVTNGPGARRLRAGGRCAKSRPSPCFRSRT